jgi:hypothetical protein
MNLVLKVAPSAKRRGALKRTKKLKMARGRQIRRKLLLTSSSRRVLCDVALSISDDPQVAN